MRREVAEGLRYVLGNRLPAQPSRPARRSSNLFTNIAFATYLVYLVRELGLDAGRHRRGARHRQHRLPSWARSRQPRRAAARGRSDHHRRGRSSAGRPRCWCRSRPPAWPIPFLLAASALGGFAAVVYNINQVSFRQAITPAADAGPHERHDALHRLGHHPDRRHHRRHPRHATRARRRPSGSAPSWACFAFLPVLLSPVRGLREMPEPVDGAAASSSVEAAVGEASSRELEVAGMAYPRPDGGEPPGEG